MMYLRVAVLSFCIVWCSAAFVDEFQSFGSNECVGEDKFQCISGNCILLMQYCDGRPDCDDGSDENFCLGHEVDVALCNDTHQFLCHDRGHCIPNSWICNNEFDCEDASDELNCTDFSIAPNATCHGFDCGNGTCISRLWVCDGHYDCEDKSDEYNEDMCKHSLQNHLILDVTYCQELYNLRDERYNCLDSSYCLPADMMCDGIKDCRDGSDEGDFCKNWKTMCVNYKCGGSNSECAPDRKGPICVCAQAGDQYNYTSHKCQDIDECMLKRPHCSHYCTNGNGNYICECDEGFEKDQFGYLCFAKGPEAMLFFSTRNEIKFLKIKSKQVVTVATGIKEAHGVSYDGKYLYWVETAKGHQSIVRAHLEDMQGTKEVLAGLGLEDPGDISIDWLGKNIYFSDAVRGTISACSLDGSHCATILTEAKHPKFITVDPRHGKMYWADFHSRSVIMSARMDGAEHDVLVDHLETFGTGLALDVPNERLYFVDGTIKVVMINRKQVYTLFEEPFHRPYSVAVFENTVFWSDLTSQTIQTTDKQHGSRQKRNVLLSADSPIFGMHMYHPALMPTKTNPCELHSCSHFCFITSNTTHVCGCPDDMYLKKNTCYHTDGFRHHYLVVAGDQRFTRIDYNMIGNPESHATHFDIGRLQAMAYDSIRDTLYLYDGQRRAINYINMSDFTIGITHMLIYQGLDNVLDMDYDYTSDTLYVVDAGRRLIEVISLRTQRRAVVYKFNEFEIPISICVLPDYGKMLVAVVETDQHNNICIESMGLDGSERSHVIRNNLKGPHVRLRYSQFMDNVFLSDEGNGVIDFMHPGGVARENFRELSTTVTSLALTDSYIFWTDRRTSRLFWTHIHESSHRNRRMDFSMFPNHTQLLIQAATPLSKSLHPLPIHPCLKPTTCTDVCVQTPTPLAQNGQMGYKCLCPNGHFMENGKCIQIAICGENEFYCHTSNICIDKYKVCDGRDDCKLKEDESGCSALLSNWGKNLGSLLMWAKLHWSKRRFPSGTIPEISTGPTKCDVTDFQCNDSALCIPRTLMCDGRNDCPDNSDEMHEECEHHHCFDYEFQCAIKSCIPKTWRCDGVEDCSDGSDEFGCQNAGCKPGYYQCRNRECIEGTSRCDGHPDCFDFSDEEDCEEQPVVMFEEAELPNCADYEIACELNKSICVPSTAQCNMKTDCPGGTDENNCDFRCTPHGMFSCKQQLVCISMKNVCNGMKDCTDGSDETPDACLIVNGTSHLYPPVVYAPAECQHGFQCANGQCINSDQVCDSKLDCFDGSDEGKQCLSACTNNSCSYACVSTPLGALCICPVGYRMSPNGHTCEDIDECASEMCSQSCINIPGSFLCKCHHGYGLRADRRSCKATRGNMSILYISGNTVRFIAADGKGSVEYSDPKIATVSDLDFDVRRNNLYVSSSESKKLIEVNSTHDTTEVTNVGQLSKVAVEWITGNVYFVDTTPGASCIRVCNVLKKRCAKLQKLPSNALVSSLIVDPKSRLMFYCVTAGLESVVWAASLSGHNARDLITVRNCTGLAVDSFSKHLYVAETGPPHIIRMDFTGDKHMKILADHPQLQAPRSLAIFEDHIYYLVANSFRLGRCLLYGPKHCEIFIYNVFDANTFIIRHESVQRDDILNECEDYTCSNICVLDETGPKCVCDDGSFANNGACKLLQKSELPLFNGWTYKEYVAYQASFAIIIAVLVLLVIYLGLFIYYHFVYKPRRARSAAYTEVRYQANGVDSALSYFPTADMATDGSVSHEFVNPLQYVRNILPYSYKKPQRPIGTAGLNIDVSLSPQLSDTESDLDDREKLIDIGRK